MAREELHKLEKFLFAIPSKGKDVGPHITKDGSEVYFSDEVAENFVDLQNKTKKVNERYNAVIAYYEQLMNDIDDNQGELTENFTSIKKQLDNNINEINSNVDIIYKELASKIADFEKNYKASTAAMEQAGDTL